MGKEGRKEGRTEMREGREAQGDKGRKERGMVQSSYRKYAFRAAFSRATGLQVYNAVCYSIPTH